MTQHTNLSDSSTVDLIGLSHFPERRRPDDPFVDLVHLMRPLAKRQW